MMILFDINDFGDILQCLKIPVPDLAKNTLIKVLANQPETSTINHCVQLDVTLIWPILVKWAVVPKDLDPGPNQLSEILQSWLQHYNMHKLNVDELKHICRHYHISTPNLSVECKLL